MVSRMPCLKGKEGCTGKNKRPLSFINIYAMEPEGLNGVGGKPGRKASNLAHTFPWKGFCEAKIYDSFGSPASGWKCHTNHTGHLFRLTQKSFLMKNVPFALPFRPVL